jgi:hypothetical protein
MPPLSAAWRTLALYAPRALWVFFDLVEAAIYTGRTEAAARVADAWTARLDRPSPAAPR